MIKLFSYFVKRFVKKKLLRSTFKNNSNFSCCCSFLLLACELSVFAYFLKNQYKWLKNQS